MIFFGVHIPRVYRMVPIFRPRNALEPPEVALIRATCAQVNLMRSYFSLCVCECFQVHEVLHSFKDFANLGFGCGHPQSWNVALSDFKKSTKIWGFQ
jgi:hypothetical protein